MSDAHCIVCGEPIPQGQIICSICDELNQKNMRIRRKEREWEYTQHVHKAKKGKMIDAIHKR